MILNFFYTFSFILLFKSIYTNMNHDPRVPIYFRVFDKSRYETIYKPIENDVVSNKKDTVNTIIEQLLLELSTIEIGEESEYLGYIQKIFPYLIYENRQIIAIEDIRSQLVRFRQIWKTDSVSLEDKEFFLHNILYWKCANYFRKSWYLEPDIIFSGLFIGLKNK